MPLSEDCEVFRKPLCKISPGCFCPVDGRLPEGVVEEIGYLESGNAVPLVGEVCALSHLTLIRLTLILSVTNVLAKCGDASVLLPFGRALGTRVLLGAGEKRNLWV